VSKTATCGTSGKICCASLIPSRQRVDRAEDTVVDQRRGGEALAAVHHAVPHRIGLQRPESLARLLPDSGRVVDLLKRARREFALVRNVE